MSRSSKRGRGGPQVFALIPEDVLQSKAMWNLSPAARHILVCLVCGYPAQRNGLMILPHSRAAEFGIFSHDTLERSLKALQENGFIVITRRVKAMGKFATEYGVTWLPLCYRDGQPLEPNEPPSHAYLRIVPMAGTKKRKPPQLSSAGIVPMDGTER